jgi:alkaline phosphatase D
MVSDPDRVRRRFLARALGLGAAAFLSPLPACATARPKFDAYPFSLGVASGAPRAHGVVIWTRLAPRPLDGGGMEPAALEVRWEVAMDPAFRRLVRHGTVIAAPDNAHAVHVEVEHLSPGREYHYRFLCGGAESAVGRTRTAPDERRADTSLKLALASCQQYEQGFFVAHRHLAAEGADLVAFVGDYIYESSWGREHVRKHASGEPRTLEEYRGRYAQYKTDADLQKAHACAPWIVTWDDHEVDNDYADDRSEDLDPAFLARRTAAYRAFLEHMPLRRSSVEANGGVRVYDRHAWGSLAALHVLDDRQYRSHQACPRSGRGGSNVVGPACVERLDPKLTMLGASQENWLDEGLARSRARWNVLVQQTLMAPAARTTQAGTVHWTDGWDGYPAARARLVASLAASRCANPVVLGGDVHCNYAADLHLDAARPDSAVVASEFCATSITSQGIDPKVVREIALANPHIHFAENTLRGYVVLDFSSKGLEARLRTVDTVKNVSAPIATRATFTVEDGRPGVRKSG